MTAFVIEEIAGQRRRIELGGRALPYQNVSWTGRTRTKQTWYPGNPVATLQVLGPELEPTKINGMWKDRFLPDQIRARGFGTIETAEQIVAAMREIQRSGVDLRVQWGFEVRFGVLTSFEANWIRPQDVTWNAEFTWSGEQEQAPRAGAAPAQQGALRLATTAVDDDFVLDPPTVRPDYRAAVLGQIDAVREKVGDVFDAVRSTTGTVEIPITAVQGALAAVESIRSETSETLTTLVDTPYTAAQVADYVVDVFKIENWRRTVALRSRVQRAEAQRQGLDLAKKAVPNAIQVIVVPENVTLRQLAISYYGNADDWQLIADVNGLTDSQVAAGTVLIITPKAAARVVA
jgi:hypothetical protein